MTTPQKMIEAACPTYTLQDLPKYLKTPTVSVFGVEYSPPLFTHGFEAPLGDGYREKIQEELNRFIARVETDAIETVGELNPKTMMIIVWKMLEVTLLLPYEEVAHMRDGVLVPLKFEWGFAIQVKQDADLLS